MASVTFTNITKTYGDTKIIEDLNLDLLDGSMTVLVGPSGCGKSTSLRMLAGLESVTSGEIKIGDRVVTNLEPKDRDIAMVFQNYALYPHLNVAANIAFPLRAKKVPRADADRRTREVAETLGLSALLKRKPRELSGGQQQRVAIGRAIVREPSVFLFDEPLSNLDAKLRVETRTELLRLQRAFGITSFYVTHDQEEAMTLSDRMVVMREGGVAQIGTPSEVYSRPNSTFVATFVGSPKMNLLDGEVLDSAFNAADGLRLELTSPVRGPVTVGVRPDDLLLEPDSDPVGDGARVALIELLGPRAVVVVDVNGRQLTSVVEANQLNRITVGARVKLGVRPGSPHYFSVDTGERIERKK